MSDYRNPPTPTPRSHPELFLCVECDAKVKGDALAVLVCDRCAKAQRLGQQWWIGCRTVHWKTRLDFKPLCDSQAAGTVTTDFDELDCENCRRIDNELRMNSRTFEPERACCGIAVDTDVSVHLRGVRDYTVRLSRVPVVGERIDIDTYGCRGCFDVVEVRHLVTDDEQPGPAADVFVTEIDL